MNARLRNAMKAHARAEFPREAAGFIVQTVQGKEYVRLKNLSGRSDQVVVCPKSQAEAYKKGEAVAFFHSHPNLPAEPSEADRVSCESMGLPWVIYPLNDYDGSIKFDPLITITPSGYQAPLIGRFFYHGVLDCYTLVQDYYSRELSIELLDFERDDEWWKKGGNLYEENFTSAGFVQVNDLQPHDVVLMQYYSPVTNHAGVFIGDAELKSEPLGFALPGSMIHHASNRLSERVIYGGYWKDITRMILRHKELL
ncbi:hypothetical protein PAEH1_02605 [Paenalcaligenes hominis]|uniref:NlpC/P60 domain-containing protein n=1 Tax=Paenalcaligenes hominis TaxID=643674 RepID=A0A1U9JY57_9BURK|nr:hypothetical protein PAEH1_02605 [Paenalcaligenes hominis]